MAVAHEVWLEVQRPQSPGALTAEEAGIDVADVYGNWADALTIKPSAAGFGPTSVTLLVTGALSAKASRVAMDLWKFVILPRIRAKWGDHALKERKAAAAPKSPPGHRKKQ